MRFNDSDENESELLDFVPRSRSAQIWNIVAAFAATVITILVLASISDVGRSISVMFFSIMLVAILCFYVVYRKQQSLDLITTAEYQNLLFSQAMALGSNFCMFVRRDGAIVYANNGLDRLFPQFGYANSQALEGLFALSGISKAEKDRVLDSIQKGTRDRAIFPIRQPDGKEQEYIITIEPLPRPAGYSFIRGREYRAERAGVQLLPDVLRATSADKLDHMLAHTPVAHYSTDAYGKLEYVNPAFEQLLGYAPGDLSGSKLTLKQLVLDVAGRPLPEDYVLAEHTGEATWKNKDGSKGRHLLFQYLMRDDNGKVIGATGSVLVSDQR